MSDQFVHPQAICESDLVGARTRIAAFAHVCAGARLGADCDICDHVLIEGDVVVGDRVTIKSGVQLWNGVRLGNDVFVGPNATFTNDKFPRSGHGSSENPITKVADGASIGANATILPGVVIGRNSMVGAGAVVTGNVPPNAIVYGNPARIHGYVDALQQRSSRSTAFDGVTRNLVGDAGLVRLNRAEDMRGALAVSEIAQTLPFVPRRFFVIYSVPSEEIRGEHAHRECHQFLVCVNGSASFLVDDGTDRADVTLDDPSLGLYMPPMTWGTQYAFSSDVALVVLASHAYDPADYIRDYDEFLRLKQG